MNRILVAAAVAVAAVMADVSARTSASAEIPHPPFAADRFQEFVTYPLLECLKEEGRKAEETKRRSNERFWRELYSNVYPSTRLEDENKEFEKIFRELNDCYIAAQIKWGVTKPLSHDQFSRMEDVIKERCDKPLEKRAAAWRPSIEHPTNLQLEQALAEMSKELGDRARTQNQCYRDAQTEWGFR
jgi:hypothetical protein